MKTKYFIRLVAVATKTKFDGPRKSTPDEAIKTLIGVNLHGYRVHLMRERGAEIWEGW